MIQREEHDWGVRLIVRPFPPIQKHAEMEIRVDISNPRPKHGPEIKVWFHGTITPEPLVYSESIIWADALRAANAEALLISQGMKQDAKAMQSAKPSKPAPKSKRPRRG